MYEQTSQVYQNILEGADLEVENTYKQTALHLASIQGHVRYMTSFWAIINVYLWQAASICIRTIRTASSQEHAWDRYVHIPCTW